MLGTYHWGKYEGEQEGQIQMTNALLVWFEKVAGRDQLYEWFKADEIGGYMETLHRLGKDINDLDPHMIVTVKFYILEEEDTYE